MRGAKECKRAIVKISSVTRRDGEDRILRTAALHQEFTGYWTAALMQDVLCHHTQACSYTSGKCRGA